MKNIKYALFFTLYAFIVFSCTSLQDINIDQSAVSEEILEIHSSFAEIDGTFAAGNGDEKAAENLISVMESALADSGVLKAVSARIYALEGCAALWLGRKAEAQKMYELSVSSSKGDVYALVLFHRLNQKQPIEESFASGNDKAVLVLEKALDCYSSKDYFSAVSCFDEAFLSLHDYYHAAYGKLRDESWNLRYASNADDSDENLQSVFLLKKIDVSQMLLITNERSNLLFNLTGGKSLGEKDLYKKASAAGLLDSASALENSSLGNDEKSFTAADFIVTKIICARFLWNLYCENKSLDEKTKYSKRFSKIKIRSPVPDVPLSNPDFDAVLGCVENEFINLDDGINFKGEKEISAIEFSESLQKVKN